MKRKTVSSEWITFGLISFDVDYKHHFDAVCIPDAERWGIYSHLIHGKTHTKQREQKVKNVSAQDSALVCPSFVTTAPGRYSNDKMT